MPWTVTLEGPSPLGFSSSWRFYYDRKKNEWPNPFKFCGSVGICQVLASLPPLGTFIVWKS